MPKRLAYSPISGMPTSCARRTVTVLSDHFSASRSVVGPLLAAHRKIVRTPDVGALPWSISSGASTMTLDGV